MITSNIEHTITWKANALYPVLYVVIHTGVTSSSSYEQTQEICFSAYCSISLCREMFLPNTTISYSNSYEQEQRNVAKEEVLELVLQCDHLWRTFCQTEVSHGCQCAGLQKRSTGLVQFVSGSDPHSAQTPATWYEILSPCSQLQKWQIFVRFSPNNLQVFLNPPQSIRTHDVIV
jgi:hypothetical protein